MRRKKILHLISGLEIGGTETQLLRILPKLQKYHQSRVCCVRGHGPIGAELEKNGIKVYYLDLKNIIDFPALIRFYKIVKDFSPDILVTYLIHADLYGRILGKLFRIKKIVSSKRGALLQWEWLAFFDRLTKRMVTHYLVQTEAAKKEWMERLKLPEKKFTVIPNGIEPKDFDITIDKETKINEIGVKLDNINIVCVSKLREGKGHSYLLKAFDDVYKQYQKINLLIVGDGDQLDNLMKQTASYESKKNIYFLKDRNDVKEILKISDIFVLPTEAEGMSNAILEAMASGLPIITTDISVNRELIKNNVNGVLIRTKNTQEIKKHLLAFLENTPLFKKFGENAKIEIARQFNLEKITRDVSSFFNHL